MKQFITLFATLVVGACSAQDTIPDFYEEPLNENVGYWKNDGQVIGTNGDPMNDVVYYSEGGFPRLFIQKNSTMSFTMAKTDTTVGTTDTLFRIDMRLTGETYQEVDPEAYVLKSYFQNFYLAHCGSTGIEAVKGYYYIVYRDVYPGIDLRVYSGSLGHKMAFICHPGSDPTDLLLEFEGQDSLGVDVDGALRMYLNENEWIKLDEAVAYQVDANENVVPLSWTAEYNNNGGTATVNFEFDTYDTALPLVLQIGPPAWLGGGPYDVDGLCWSTYVGGDADEEIFESAQDADDHYYVAGNTNSSFLTFPSASGTNYSTTGKVAFLLQFNDNDGIDWKDFFGGDVLADETFATGVADRGTGNIYMAGHTTSTTILHADDLVAYYDGVATSSTPKGFLARFLKLNGLRQWSTYFGDENTVITGMVGTDNVASPRLYITGYCQGGLPALDVSPPANSTFWNYDAGNDGFICAFNGNDEHYWRTYLPGSGDDRGVQLAREKYKMYVLGSTTSNDMNISSLGGNAYEEGHFGGLDCFLYEFNIYGAWQWGTYIGTTGADRPGENAISIDPVTDDVAIAGNTDGTFTVVNGPGWYQDAVPPSGCTSGFLARFNHPDRALAWHTYLHGNDAFSYVYVQTLCFDATGNLNIGATPRWGDGFPVVPLTGMYQQPVMNQNYSGGAYEQCDMYVMSLTPDHYLSYAMYVGGRASDSQHEMMYTMLPRDLNGDLYTAGFTTHDLFDPLFPLDNGDGLCYFEALTQGSVFETFITRFCASPLTGLDDGSSTGEAGNAWVDAEGNLQVTGLPPGFSGFAVHDITGRLVARGRASVSGAGGCTIPFAHAAAGTYVVQVGGEHAIPVVKSQP